MSRIIPAKTAFSKQGRVKTRPKVKKRSIQQVDQIFSLCVRERADWTCECCGKGYERGSPGLHCSHLFSRRHRSTRWAPENCAAHCMHCHSYLGGNPIIFAKWIEAHLGPGPLERLHQRMRETVKVRPQDREDLYQHYKAEHERLLSLRDRGVTGRIPIEGWR